MLIFRILLFIIISSAVVPAFAIYPQASHMLDSLDYYIENHNSYREIKCTTIRAKCNEIEATAKNCARLPLYEDIIKRYVHVEADSALAFAERALRLCRECGDSTDVAKFRALRCAALTFCGEVHLATVMFNEIDANSIAEADKEIYYECSYAVYSRAFIYLRQDTELENVENKLKASLDSIIKYSTEPTRSRFYSDVRQIHTVNTVDGVADMIDLLNSETQGTYLYGQTALEIAHYYAKAEQYDLAKYYYTVAGINNLKGGYNETASLHGLGVLLHDEGDITRANRYLKTSLDRALLVGDNAAAMRISQSLKTLLDDVSNDASAIHKSWMIAMMFVVFLTVLVICWAVFFFYKRNKYHNHNRTLSERHYSKDFYIRQILALCASQITSFGDYNRLVGRKIKGSQVQDLLRISESGSAVEEQMETFHSTFDSAFLSMHPDFVERVNKLMQEDKQLTTAMPGSLNTDLRLLAFMSLGLDDSQQLAILLNINQSSVYTYRNKLKSRVIDRANFEENVRKLA